jgi:hypothetical protein
MGTLRVKRPERETDNSHLVPRLRMSVAGLLFHICFHGADSANFTFGDVQFVGAVHRRAYVWACCRRYVRNVLQPTANTADSCGIW